MSTENGKKKVPGEREGIAQPGRSERSVRAKKCFSLTVNTLRA